VGSSYRRISTDEERRPFSLDAQQERLAAYVAVQPGWVLTRSYSDRMSGKRLGRPGLQQALHDARAGRYELLLVFKVDRLARSTGGLARCRRNWTPPALLPVGLGAIRHRHGRRSHDDADARRVRRVRARDDRRAHPLRTRARFAEADHQAYEHRSSRCAAVGNDPSMGPK
jgi:hypothetical protein